VKPITYFAPAKLNLTLEVLGRRSDGYHEIRSIMQAVSLGDGLTFSLSDTLSFECDLPGWNSEKSLVSRAAALLLNESGSRKGADVRIVKRIPLASGLGGDASDAAAVLRGLSALWSLEVPLEELAVLATGLGSDVPFFLSGSAALARGRGEIITSLPAIPKHWFVIMTPDVPRPTEKTAAVYTRLRETNYTSGIYTEALKEYLTHAEGITDDMLYNVFEGVAYDLFPGLEGSREAMIAAGVARVHLAGAGPSLYSLHASRAEAEMVCARLAGQPVYVAEALGSINY